MKVTISVFKTIFIIAVMNCYLKGENSKVLKFHVINFK